MHTYGPALAMTVVLLNANSHVNVYQSPKYILYTLSCLFSVLLQTNL